jgi:DNA-binding NtrC family response regulator
LNSSYILISIGDLRELLPILNELEKNGDNANQAKLLPKSKNIINDNKIIPIPILEVQLLETALIKTHGDIDKTAEELGISKRSVYRKLKLLRSKKYGYKESQNS